MKKLSGIIYFTLFLGLCFSSCSDDSGNQDSGIRIEFDFNIDGEALEYGKVYQINNSTVTFGVANFYLGGLNFTQENMNIIELGDQYLLAGMGNSANISGSIANSKILRTQFFVGVDAVTNSQTEADFTSRSSSDPLGIQDPSMHWNWNTGYKFLRVDGDVDTDDDGVVDTAIAYHLGSDPLLTNFDINRSIEITEGQNVIYFTFDLAKFFSGVDLSTEIDTHTGNNLPLAERLVSNMPAAISIR